MAVVPADERVATLREWGVSDPLIRLSCGERIHKQLEYYSYTGPPGYIYEQRSGVRPPRGPQFAPLWELNEAVTGVWMKNGSLQFIDFEFARPDEYEVLASTEQGFWATIFDFLYETDAPVEELHELAEVIAFRYLDRLLTTRDEAKLGTHELHKKYLNNLVFGIDKES